MKRCPREIVVRELPALTDETTLSVPLASIAAQLPSGKVELSSLQFVGALPGAFIDYFHPIDGVKVPLPLQEILEKLPLARRDNAKETAPASDPPTRIAESNEISEPTAAPVVASPAPHGSSSNTARTSPSATPASAAARARMKTISTSGKLAAAATPKKARGTKKPLKELAQRLASLPGVRGCAIVAHDEHAIAGEFDRGMDLAAVRGLGLQLDSLLRAGEAPVVGNIREAFFPGELASFACCLGADVAVIALLRTQTPLPIVRQELAAAVAALNSKSSPCS
jgi:hypothetical protein